MRANTNFIFATDCEILMPFGSLVAIDCTIIYLYVFFFFPPKRTVGIICYYIFSDMYYYSTLNKFFMVYIAVQIKRSKVAPWVAMQRAKSYQFLLGRLSQFEHT